MKAQIPYNKRIAEIVKDGAAKGLSRTAIFVQVAHFQDAPRNFKTFARLYGADYQTVKNEINASIGNKVIEQALSGDFPSQQLYLKSHGDWNPKETVEVLDGDDNEESGITAAEALVENLFPDE